MCKRGFIEVKKSLIEDFEAAVEQVRSCTIDGPKQQGWPQLL